MVPEDARNEKYPYQVMSEHQRLRTHSQWVNVPVMRELDPEPSAKLHPDTAEATASPRATTCASTTTAARWW